MVFKNQTLIKILLAVILGCIIKICSGQNENDVSVDAGYFKTSARHWYNFFDDGYIIQPLPGQTQYDESEITAIADNILLFQRDNGGWPKNYDMRAILTDGQKIKLTAVKSILETTFDNSTTYPQINYLAKVYNITGVEKYKNACLEGIDFILDAQYENGGWPQFYPPRKKNNDYSSHITYNDQAYVGIMGTLKDIVYKEPDFSFIDDKYRERIQEAFDKGLQCILNCQIVEDGMPKIWCQQHDEKSLEPTWARSFEPPCFCNDESGGIVLFLMTIEKPADNVVQAVKTAVRWFEKSKILNTRCIDDPTAPAYISKHKVHRYDRRIVHDLNAPPIWTRFSELKTGKPIFCDRSGEIVYNMSDLSRERRSGYRWYTYNPQKVLDKYPNWKAKWTE